MTKRYLSKHTKRHTVTERYKCSHCNNSYSERSKLTNHIQLAHSEGNETRDDEAAEPQKETEEPQKEVKQLECSICNVSFKFTHHLKKHMTIHTSLRPYACTECNGTYKTLPDLNRHKKIHAADRPHKCMVCHKGFVATSDLKRHLRTHTGAKPYICEICNQGFSQSSSLRKHKEKKHPTLPLNNQQQLRQQQQQQTDSVGMDGMSTVQDILNWIGRSENRDDMEIYS